nr:hypothetical protein [Micromonospora sp. DSM 115978]
MSSPDHERLTIRLESTEKALIETRRELFDARARLALVARLVRDEQRIRRAPSLVFGAIRAAVFCDTAHLTSLARRLAMRRSF